MGKLNIIKIENKELEKKLIPLLVFFDSIANSHFVRYVEYLTRNIGIGIEGATGCTFPSDLDEYQIVVEKEGFNGVNFSFYEDEITLDIPTFRKYLRIACEAYWTEHPESKAQLQEYLARPQPPLEEGALPLWKEMRDAGKFLKPYSEFE